MRQELDRRPTEYNLRYYPKDTVTFPFSIRESDLVTPLDLTNKTLKAMAYPDNDGPEVEMTITPDPLVPGNMTLSVSDADRDSLGQVATYEFWWEDITVVDSPVRLTLAIGRIERL